MRCVKSLLSKENTLEHKKSEVLAKKLLRNAKQKLEDAEKKGKGDDGLSRRATFLKAPKIKTLDDINAEKERMLTFQAEKLKRDRQTVLDNIYLLRLQEMYPEAHIEIPEHIQILIDIYMRRNMVSMEIKQELAETKLLLRKPRPHKLIKGEASVSAERKYIYHDNDPLDLKKKQKLYEQFEKEAKKKAKDQPIFSGGGSLKDAEGGSLNPCNVVTLEMSPTDISQTAREIQLNKSLDTVFKMHQLELDRVMVQSASQQLKQPHDSEQQEP